MSALRNFDTKELLEELMNREHIKSTEIGQAEIAKVTVYGEQEQRFRYIKGSGGSIILIVNAKARK